MDFISEIESATGRKLEKSFVEAQLGDVEVNVCQHPKIKIYFWIFSESRTRRGSSEFHRMV